MKITMRPFFHSDQRFPTHPTVSMGLSLLIISATIMNSSCLSPSQIVGSTLGCLSSGQACVSSIQTLPSGQIVYQHLVYYQVGMPIIRSYCLSPCQDFYYHVRLSSGQAVNNRSGRGASGYRARLLIITSRGLR